MSVFNRILTEIPNETELYTPVQKKPFKVLVDAEKEIVHLLARKTIIFIPREDWNGIPDYLNGEGIGDGWFPIGAKHGKATEGTLQWHSDQFFSLDKTHSADACYLASVLKHLDIVEINPNKPSRVRLKEKGNRTKKKSYPQKSTPARTLLSYYYDPKSALDYEHVPFMRHHCMCSKLFWISKTSLA